MTKEPNLTYYYTHFWRENNWINTFPNDISAAWNAISLVQDWTCVTVYISYDDNHYITSYDSINHVKL